MNPSKNNILKNLQINKKFKIIRNVILTIFLWNRFKKIF